MFILVCLDLVWFDLLLVFFSFYFVFSRVRRHFCIPRISLTLSSFNSNFPFVRSPSHSQLTRFPLILPFISPVPSIHLFL